MKLVALLRNALTVDQFMTINIWKLKNNTYEQHLLKTTNLILHLLMNVTVEQIFILKEYHLK